MGKIKIINKGRNPVSIGGQVLYPRVDPYEIDKADLEVLLSSEKGANTFETFFEYHNEQDVKAEEIIDLRIKAEVAKTEAYWKGQMAKKQSSLVEIERKYNELKAVQNGQKTPPEKKTVSESRPPLTQEGKEAFDPLVHIAEKIKGKYFIVNVGNDAKTEISKEEFEKINSQIEGQ